MSVKEAIQAKITSKKVVVYSKTWCPYCTTAKQVFKKCIEDGILKSEDYEIIELDKQSHGNEIQAEMKKLTRAGTVPRVFINGKCIGGGSDTEAYYKSGKLNKLLQ